MGFKEGNNYNAAAPSIGIRALNVCSPFYYLGAT